MRARVLVCLALGWGCALDIPDPISGDASQEVGGSDAVFDVQTCTTIDAACLPQFPSGWVPVVVADAGCASGWASSTFETNARLDSANGCGCSCTVSGAYDCSTATLTVQTGAGCASTQTETVGACNQFTPAHFGYTAYPVAAGSPICNAATQPPTVDTDPVTTCAPVSCNMDFCGAPGRKCIAMPTAATCPTGFPNLIAAGTGSTGTCPSCGCTVSAAPSCPGILLAYNGTSCSGSAVGFEGSPGSCYVAGTDGGVFSLVFRPSGDASTTCSPTTIGSGSASLTGATTICCAN